MVPHKLTFEESLHACKKLSGSLASYVNKTEFDDIVYFVSLTKNMNSQGCIEKLEDGNNIEVWAGGMDDRQEGLWETWNTREPIKVNLHYTYYTITLKNCFFSTCLGLIIDLTRMETCTTVL